MKKYILFFTLAIITACGQEKKEIQPKEIVEHPYLQEELKPKSIYDAVKEEHTISLKDFSFRGKVKKLKVKIYYTYNFDIDVSKYQLTNSNRGYEFMPIDFHWDMEMTFNEEGNLLKSEGVDNTDEYNDYEVYECHYNDYGDITYKKYKSYRKIDETDEINSVILKQNFYTYNNDFQMIEYEEKEKREGISREYNSSEKYTYFPKENRVEETFFEEGEFLGSTKNTYDIFGLMRKKEYFSAIGKSNGWQTYDYDAYGNLTMTTDDEGEALPEEVDTEWKVYRLFDEHGNYIERYTVFSDTPRVNVTKWEIEYY